MNKALNHEESDQVPISDFFWGSFIKRWRSELNLPADADPHKYYDLDWIAVAPAKICLMTAIPLCTPVDAARSSWFT